MGMISVGACVPLQALQTQFGTPDRIVEAAKEQLRPAHRPGKE
jgi:hypothetical protein